MKDTQREALLFGDYLIGKEIGLSAVSLYEKAMSRTQKLDSRDQKILSLALRHPATIGLLDAGLALVRPHAELRRRLFILTAILESDPAQAQLFLPVKRPWWYIFVVLWAGVRAACRAIAGVVLIRVIV